MNTVPCTGLIGAYSAVVGAILLAIGLFVSLRARASQKWPMALGQIVSSTITASYNIEAGLIYSPSIDYAYDVGGRAYHGSRVAFGGLSGNPQKYIDRYPAGAAVPVYYNPANPRDATLERRAASSTFLFTAGILLFLIGFGLIVMPWALFQVQQAIP